MASRLSGCYWRSTRGSLHAMAQVAAYFDGFWSERNGISYTFGPAKAAMSSDLTSTSAGRSPLAEE